MTICLGPGAEHGPTGGPCAALEPANLDRAPGLPGLPAEPVHLEVVATGGFLALLMALSGLPGARPPGSVAPGPDDPPSKNAP